MKSYSEVWKEFSVSEFKDELLKIKVASEVAAIFGNTNDEFDQICSFVEDCYLHTESYDLNAICCTIRATYEDQDEYESYAEFYANTDVAEILENMD